MTWSNFSVSYFDCDLCICKCMNVIWIYITGSINVPSVIVVIISISLITSCIISVASSIIKITSCSAPKALVIRRLPLYALLFLNQP